jgi:hypothetical protein
MLNVGQHLRLDRSALQEELGYFRWKTPPPYAPGWPAPSIAGMLPPFLPHIANEERS